MRFAASPKLLNEWIGGIWHSNRRTIQTQSMEQNVAVLMRSFSHPTRKQLLDCPARAINTNPWASDLANTVAVTIKRMLTSMDFL